MNCYDAEKSISAMVFIIFSLTMSAIIAEFCLVMPYSTAFAAQTEVVQANRGSGSPKISRNGRYVAFYSIATNLVPNDYNNVSDVFIHDRETRRTVRVSVTSSGKEANGLSVSVRCISSDKRYIMFCSKASNLDACKKGRPVSKQIGHLYVHDLHTGRTYYPRIDIAEPQGASDNMTPAQRNANVLLRNNLDYFVYNFASGRSEQIIISPNMRHGGMIGARYAKITPDGRWVLFASKRIELIPNIKVKGVKKKQVFLHDRLKGMTKLVSITSNGNLANGPILPSLDISDDGRYVVFASHAWNLLEGDTNKHADVFVADLLKGSIVRVSVDSNGQQGNNDSKYPVISANGRYAAFISFASNLVPNDTNNKEDTFVHDLKTGKTTRVNVSSRGEQGNGFGGFPSISADGRVVAFCSKSSNLVADDTNNANDIFVHDLFSGQTERVSVSKKDTAAVTKEAKSALEPTEVYFRFHEAMRTQDLKEVKKYVIHDYYGFLSTGGESGIIIGLSKFFSKKIDITDSLVSDTTANLALLGKFEGKPVTGHAQLIKEHGRWKLAEVSWDVSELKGDGVKGGHP